MNYSVFTPFLRRFTDEVQLERTETIALYNEVRQKHVNSVWAAPDIVDRISRHVAHILAQLIDIPAYLPLAEALDRCQQEVIALEKTVVSFPEIDWNRAHLSMLEAVDLRRFLRAKQHFLANEDRVFDELQNALGNIIAGIIQSLPAISGESDATFTVPLYELMPNAAEMAQGIINVLMTDQILESGLFTELQNRLYENVCRASGIAPDAKSSRRLITPDQSDLPPAELLDTYLAGTPFLDLFLTPIPFSIPEETRFSGHWIIAPPGRGKTTLLHAMFLADIQRDASIIVMDSKGDVINPIKNLKLVADRLLLIEPDANFPLALNPLDIPKTNIAHTVSLLEYVFSALLEAKMTSLQMTLFRSVLPALVEVVPNATLETFRDVIENGIGPYKQYLDKLSPDLRDFFTRHFNSKTYADTRSQLIWRLQFLMTNPVIKQMFSALKTKLDIGKEMDAGKIILIDNSKQKLGDEGSEFFGRFFIALVLAAAQQRAGRSEHEKLPCYFYIDECQNVIRRDEKISTILDECRSQKIAMILAHQRTAQISSANVLDALANCAIRMANSDDEAKYLSDKLRMDTESLRALPRGTFATFVRDLTPKAVALKIPYPDLSTLPRINAAEQQAIRARMREQFSFTPQSNRVSADAGAQAGKPSADSPGTHPAPPPSDPHTGDHTKPATTWGDE